MYCWDTLHINHMIMTFCKNCHHKITQFMSCVRGPNNRFENKDSRWWNRIA